MTVIAWDGTELVADGRLSLTNGSVLSDSVQKIFRVDAIDSDRKYFVGLAGSSAMCEVVLNVIFSDVEAFIRGTLCELKGEPRDIEGLIIDPKDERIYMINDNLTVTELYDSYAACGSGATVASVAMKLGKTAREAVELAIQMNGFCGGNILTLR